ncbi:MAG: hypothetical protein P4L55_06400 [Syntrophobacteraceae bacterium]|nr:hypothetical protein [Syntrophobacteraceae bacterium]
MIHQTMNQERLKKVRFAVGNFVEWLERYGETSWDHQTFFAGGPGAAAKALYYRKPLLGTLAVAPMIFCEAFLPGARRFFWKPLRFPIADAHYAMGFAFLSDGKTGRHYQKSVHFLHMLEASRSPGFRNYCWGYPFDWVTRNGTIAESTPMITSTPYAYEAFRQAYGLDEDEHWLAVCKSIAEHAMTDIHDFETSPAASTCSYTPYDKGGVVNAAAYRANLLSAAASDFPGEGYWQVGERNLNFVLEAQQPDGSWFYSVDGVRDFVDHFHTCFVLKALAKIDKRIENNDCRKAIDRGVEYYLANLLDENGLPKPFSRAPRLTVYRRELYDCAECINLCLLLRKRIPSLNRVLERVVDDLLARWVKPDGSFRSRELYLGWDNVPMHRWAQSQMFRSLAFLLHDEETPMNGDEKGTCQ